MDIFDEELLTMKMFCEEMGFSCTKVHRMIKSGHEAVDGRIVRLESVITETGRKTSIAAYRRFLIDLNTDKEVSRGKDEQADDPGSDSAESHGDSSPSGSPGQRR